MWPSRSLTTFGWMPCCSRKVACAYHSFQSVSQNSKASLFSLYRAALFAPNASLLYGFWDRKHCYACLKETPRPLTSEVFGAFPLGNVRLDAEAPTKLGYPDVAYFRKTHNSLRHRFLLSFIFQTCLCLMFFTLLACLSASVLINKYFLCRHWRVHPSHRS